MEAQGQYFCQSHRQTTVVYCKECEKPLCGDCLAEHRKHNYLTLQEIEREIIPLMHSRELKGEGVLQRLKEQHQRLLTRIKSIREQQEERELAIENYIRLMRGMVHSKHKEMISVEEEMISKLIPLTFKVERQILNAKQEITECKARLTELQGLKQPERMWKALHIMLERKVYAFEQDQNVQQQQAEALLHIGEGDEAPLGVLFEQVPGLDVVGLDPIKIAIKSEKIVFKDIVRKLKEDYDELSEKHTLLLAKIGQIKGIFLHT